MEGLDRRYCYFCMCSTFPCDACQWCTCTPVNLEFSFDEKNELHDAFKKARIERRIHQRKIRDLQKAVKEQKTERLQVPSNISEIHNLWNPRANTAVIEENLEFLHEDAYNKRSVEHEAFMNLLKDELVQSVTTTAENLKFGNCAKLSNCAIDRERYCPQLKALIAATENEHEIFFFGSFAEALYRQCQQFGLVKDGTKLPFKVSCNAFVCDP